MSDGLSGVASTRTTTWSGPGAGTSTSTNDTSTVPAPVTIERNCNPCAGTCSDTFDPLLVLAPAAITGAGRTLTAGSQQKGRIPRKNTPEGTVALSAATTGGADAPA